jgi:hypothetical protein
MYNQQPQPGMAAPGTIPYGGSPPPQPGQQGYMSPQPTGMQPAPNQQPQYVQQQGQQQNPGMPPQQSNGTVFQAATPIASLGRGPAPADCPACGQRAMTNVSYEVGNATHAWALGLCCFTWCFCWVPYIMNSLKDVQHKCGKCGVLLATWHRSGTTEVHIHN